MPSPSRSFPAGIALAAAVLLLAACSPEASEPSTTDTPTSAAAEPTGSPAATEQPDPEPTEEPIPFQVDCEQVLSAQQVYDFNPNYGVDPGYEPTGEAAIAVDEDLGTACGYLNQTSGEVIEVAVATPPPAALEARMNAAATSSSVVPTYGTPPDVEGYFIQSGGTGQAQVFTRGYWIVLSSPALFEPGDAQQLVAAIIGNLPA